MKKLRLTAPILRILTVILSALICSSFSADATPVKCTGKYCVKIIMRKAGNGEIHSSIVNLSENNLLLYSLFWDYIPGKSSTVALISAGGVKREELSYIDSIPANMPIPAELYVDCDQGNISLRLLSDQLVFEKLSFPVYSANLSCQPEKGSGIIVENYDVSGGTTDKSPIRKERILVAIVLLIDIIIAVAVYSSRRRKGKTDKSDSPIVLRNPSIMVQGTARHPSSIFLFGPFAVISASGEDISGKFSGLLKELLAILICSSAKKGISSSDLNSLLWFDMDSRRASNNRSVYFSKLRNLLKEVGDVSIVNDNGYWKFEAGSVYVDYFRYREIVARQELDRNAILDLNGIVGGGSFLDGFEETWSDDFKSDVSEVVISLLVEALLKLDIKTDENLILHLCDVVCANDLLNETALIIRCKIAKENGRHSKAHQLYDSYVREYRRLYGENYKLSYEDITLKGILLGKRMPDK